MGKNIQPSDFLHESTIELLEHYGADVKNIALSEDGTYSMEVVCPSLSFENWGVTINLECTDNESFVQNFIKAANDYNVEEQMAEYFASGEFAEYGAEEAEGEYTDTKDSLMAIADAFQEELVFTKSTIERAYMAKFETYFEDIAADKNDKVMQAFAKAKENWEHSKSSEKDLTPIKILSGIEDAIMGVAFSSPHYDAIRSTMVSAQLQMVTDEGFGNGFWMTVENGEFVAQTDEQIAADPNRTFFRSLGGEEGNEKYEVVSSHNCSAYFHTIPISAVMHWEEFDPKAVFETLDKSDIEWLQSETNMDDLTKMSSGDFAVTMLWNGGESQPCDRSTSGGEFYQHEILEYMKQLDSTAPLSPSAFQENKTVEQSCEDYEIAAKAAGIYDKQEPAPIDNEKIENRKSNKNDEYSLG